MKRANTGGDLREQISSRHGSKKQRTAEHTEFDLLPKDKKSTIFKVVFDYYTPRSHFVILPRDEGLPLEGTDYNQLKAETRKELIKAALGIVSEYKLDRFAALSVHRGSWITTKHKFHAHVCADVQDYIRVFREEEKQIPGWPSSSFVTKQWKANKNPRRYEDNVRGYPFRTYLQEELQDIRAIRNGEQNKDKAKEKTSSTMDTFKDFSLVYHSSEPKVGFSAAKKPEATVEDYLQTLDAMDKFAEEKKLTDLGAKGDDKGCHLCVVLDSTNHGFAMDEEQSIQGYIQLSGPKYYQEFCPDTMKESWFKTFSSKKDYKVYT